MGPVVRSGNIRSQLLPTGLSWAAAYKPKDEGSPCGDGYLIQESDTAIKLAVVDGAGSGARAAEAAACCIRKLAATESGSLSKLFDTAHAACLGTCGAALAMSIIDPFAGKMAWAAVGDIEGLLLNTSRDGAAKRAAIVQRGGTLGHHMPRIMPQTHGLAPGDVLIMSSDGVRHDHRDAIETTRSAKDLAARTLGDYGRANDDALVLVLKCDTAR